MQSLIKLLYFALGFYKGLLGLLNPVDKFTISFGSIWIYDYSLFFVNNTVLCFQTMHHLPLACLSSLLLFLKKTNKKTAGTSHKKISKWKQAHVGMEPSKTRWERHHNTFTPSILPTMYNKKLSTHSLNEHSTQHCSLHSLPNKRQSISDSATFSSNKIQQHNLKLPTYHTDPALLTVFAYKTDYTCHAQ